MTASPCRARLARPVAPGFAHMIRACAGSDSGRVHCSKVRILAFDSGESVGLFIGRSSASLNHRPTSGTSRSGVHSFVGVRRMKRIFQIGALVAASALYFAGQTSISAEQKCARGKQCATGKHIGKSTVGSATRGAGAGKIKGVKPALNPQPLPPGVKQPPTSGK